MTTAPAMTAPADKPVMVFRLLSGRHEDVKPGWTRPVDANGKPIMNDPDTGVPILPQKHVYDAHDPANNIIRTHVDLAKKFGSDKFQRLSADGSVTGENLETALQDSLAENSRLAEKVKQLEEMLAGSPQTHSTDPGYSGMSLKQLVEHCEANEIDLSGVNKRSKDDVLAAIMLHENNG